MALEALLLPSEIARLVYGYLKDENCSSAAASMLTESPYLKECLTVSLQGGNFSTKVCRFSLINMLDIYCTVSEFVQLKWSTIPESDISNISREDLLAQVKYLLECQKKKLKTVDMSTQTESPKSPIQVIQNGYDKTDVTDEFRNEIERIDNSDECVTITNIESSNEVKEMESQTPQLQEELMETNNNDIMNNESSPDWFSEQDIMDMPFIICSKEDDPISRNITPHSSGILETIMTPSMSYFSPAYETECQFQISDSLNSHQASTNDTQRNEVPYTDLNHSDISSASNSNTTSLVIDQNDCQKIGDETMNVYDNDNQLVGTLKRINILSVQLVNPATTEPSLVPMCQAEITNTNIEINQEQPSQKHIRVLDFNSPLKDSTETSCQPFSPTVSEKEKTICSRKRHSNTNLKHQVKTSQQSSMETLESAKYDTRLKVRKEEMKEKQNDYTKIEEELQMIAGTNATEAPSCGNTDELNETEKEEQKMSKSLYRFGSLELMDILDLETPNKNKSQSIPTTPRFLSPKTRASLPTTWGGDNLRLIMDFVKTPDYPRTPCVLSPGIENKCTNDKLAKVEINENISQVTNESIDSDKSNSTISSVAEMKKTPTKKLSKKESEILYTPISSKSGVESITNLVSKIANYKVKRCLPEDPIVPLKPQNSISRWRNIAPQITKVKPTEEKENKNSSCIYNADERNIIDAVHPETNRRKDRRKKINPLDLICRFHFPNEGIETEIKCTEYEELLNINPDRKPRTKKM